MIGLLKIGCSQRHPAIRAAELSSSTGVPAPFTVELFLDVTDRYKAEAAVHAALEPFCENKSREFYRINIPKLTPNYTSASRDRVALTDPGWLFAMAGNPVLDGTQEGPTQKFTDEERHILLSHIQSSVPVEDSAFRSVLTAVDSGVTSPNEMDEDFMRLVSDAPVSAAFVSTQRSGAVARMVDLGLLVRSREGVRVEYLLTEEGGDYLSGKLIQRRNDT